MSDWSLERAKQIATRAHAGAVDMSGQPYIQHPLRVMGAVEGEVAKAAAVLHDVLEDTPVTADDLRAEGCPEEVLEAVQALTLARDESYEAYLLRVRKNPIALKVKFADIADNTDERRLATLSPEEAQRLRQKYARARVLLGKE